MNVRVRFGVNIGGWFKNAGIFVFRCSPNKFSDIRDAVDTLKTLLAAADQQDLADRIVCEKS